MIRARASASATRDVSIVIPAATPSQTATAPIQLPPPQPHETTVEFKADASLIKSIMPGGESKACRIRPQQRYPSEYDFPDKHA
jgi:hypothetical protein